MTARKTAAKTAAARGPKAGPGPRGAGRSKPRGDAGRTARRRDAGHDPAPAMGREGYHHGALRAALIDATEALLAERGTAGFSLREVARRSGVSPAAPAHHFGDAAGLLRAVSTLAFDGLTAALRAGDERGGSDAVARLREQGLGYVGFALGQPGRFGLMFRCLPDDAGGAGPPDEALERSARDAFGVLEDGVRLLLGVPPSAPLSATQWQAILSTWSLVHGFAHLALAGQFDAVLRAMAAGGAGALRPRERIELLQRMLAPMLEQHLRGLLAAPG